MTRTPSSRAAISAAERLEPLTRRLVPGGRAGWPFAVRLWDGSEIPSSRPGTPALIIHSRQALERILRAPKELGLARAWVAGEISFDGDIEAGLAAADSLRQLRPTFADRLALLAAAVRLGALRLRRPPVPASEARLRGRRRSVRRDRTAIAYHYDIPGMFYELVLGPTRGYTCGYYHDAADTLEEAQTRKFDRVCRKLGLQSGQRLLDIGCGWGGLMIHAARHYDARVVGITISEAQAHEVRQRICAAGVADQCEVRLCDWREITDGPYDNVASVEMIEHVGAAGLPAFFAQAHALTAPGGAVFTQAIVRDVPSTTKSSSSFITRYIFPDGELVSVIELLEAMTAAGLEIRDLESLRAHYPTTLRAWIANLDQHRQEAIELAGIERVRAWDIYLAASALTFERGALSVYQILAAGAPARTPAVRPRRCSPSFATSRPSARSAGVDRGARAGGIGSPT
jgi:cyclopropane-fatty-acyl-phospholipid synthase